MKVTIDRTIFLDINDFIGFIDTVYYDFVQEFSKDVVDDIVDVDGSSHIQDQFKRVINELR